MYMMSRCSRAGFFSALACLSASLAHNKTESCALFLCHRGFLTFKSWNALAAAVSGLMNPPTTPLPHTHAHAPNPPPLATALLHPCSLPGHLAICINIIRRKRVDAAGPRGCLALLTPPPCRMFQGIARHGVARHGSESRHMYVRVTAHRCTSHGGQS